MKIERINKNTVRFRPARASYLRLGLKSGTITFSDMVTENMKLTEGDCIEFLYDNSKKQMYVAKTNDDGFRLRYASKAKRCCITNSASAVHAFLKRYERVMDNMYKVGLEPEEINGLQAFPVFSKQPR